MGNGGEAKVTWSTNQKGRMFKRRSTGWETIMKAPIPKLIKQLSDRGFCTKEGEPTPKSAWAYLDAEQIVSLYSSVNRGIQNYYRFADNWGQVNRVQYILEYSLAKTLARKYQISMSKVFKRFGRGFTIVIKGKGGKEDRKVSFYLNRDGVKKRDAFQNGKHQDIDLVQTAMRMRTRSKLGQPCCIGGERARQIVMHHVRPMRKLSNKREATGFNRILRMLNRKQIPVCETCHRKIHRGTYDSLKLPELAYLPRSETYGETPGEPCALKGASTVRRGEVSVLGQLRPGLLPDSHRDLTDDRGRGWQDPRSMSKARLPEVQLTVVENGAYGKASEAHTNLCRGYQSRPLQPPEVRTVASEVT